MCVPLKASQSVPMDTALRKGSKYSLHNDIYTSPLPSPLKVSACKQNFKFPPSVRLKIFAYIPPLILCLSLSFPLSSVSRLPHFSCRYLFFFFKLLKDHAHNYFGVALLNIHFCEATLKNKELVVNGIMMHVHCLVFGEIEDLHILIMLSTTCMTCEPWIRVLLRARFMCSI